MEIEIIRSPVTVGVVRDFFGAELNARIFEEMLALEDRFQPATVTAANVVDPSMRTNRVLYLDTEYLGRRDESVLLGSMDRRIQSPWLHQLGHALGHPVCELFRTDWSETQLSWYGDAQEYHWHHDRNSNRLITLVYYAFQTPRRFRGGEICLTDGVVMDGGLPKQRPEPRILQIPPENDMAVLFASSVGHRVTPVQAGPAFAEGRFSVNCWVGFR